jgi:hypothetical protein
MKRNEGATSPLIKFKTENHWVSRKAGFMKALKTCTSIITKIAHPLKRSINKSLVFSAKCPTINNYKNSILILNNFM